MLDRAIGSLKNHGRSRAQLSSDLWREIPRVGALMDMDTLELPNVEAQIALL
jgi:hypothetical protein